MPRTYKKLTNREFNPECMKQAVIGVINDNMSYRDSAKEYGVSKSSLAGYVKRAREFGINNVEFAPNFRKSQVFSSDMEDVLERYLLKCSAMFYGLTPNATRRLAYEYAVKNSIRVPEVWNTDKIAGRDWFGGFLKRHPRLSIRKPEATSLARMTSFNPTNLKIFQDKLAELIGRYSFEPMQIFNLDETGITTVQRVPKIVGRKGEHQIGQATSRERGELITQVGIISAAGIALPPIWIFPRQRYDEKRMMKEVSGTGTLGLVHPSGWMTANNFLEVLKHLQKNTNCSVTNKILLIMDNHESHLSLPGIEYCRANGIVILTLPPHTSNKLQPLDRTVFGPFKTFFNQGVNSWLLTHPGQTLSIYDLPLIGLQSWDRAATPTNIKSGFKCTGIVPFDKGIFKEDDFLSAYVTDRQNPNSETVEIDNNEQVDNNLPSTSQSILLQNESVTSITSSCNENASPRGKTDSSYNNSAKDLSGPEENKNQPSSLQGSSSNKVTPIASSNINTFLSPEILRPFPKAPKRKESGRARKRGKCMIATDTPEKNEIEEKQAKKKLKLDKVKAVKKNLCKDDSDDDEQSEIIYNDNSSDDELIFDSDNEDMSVQDIPEGSYIITKVHGKCTVRNYAAKILKKHADGYEVNFLKRHVSSNRFTIRLEDEAFVPFSDILCKLPQPINDTRERFKDMLYFNMDLIKYSLN